EGKALQIYSSTQGPYAVQKGVARILGIPLHRVEVDVRRLGGGFGGKEDQATIWACMAALGAWQTGRPVEIVLRRSEDMAMTGKRHPYSSDFKIGLDRQGRILAFEARHFQNSGAAADLSTAVLERTLFHSTNSYFIPNVRIFAACCRTNLPPNTAFRGFGGPQGMFVIESAIAQAAEVMGMPRREIQRRNLLQDGDPFPYGQKARKCRARTCWDEAVRAFSLEEWQQEVDAYNAELFPFKKGLALMPVCFGISFTAIPKNQAGALVHVYTDGSVSVSTGGVEMGQGLSTNIASVVARTLGIGADRIRVESTNTTRVANMSPSAASATTLLNGNAARLAAEEILQRMKRVAASQLQSSASAAITVEDEKVLCDGEETGWDWPKLVMTAHLARTSLSSHAFFATPGIWFDKGREQGQPFAYHAYGTAAIEVTIDCLRGIYALSKIRIVHDLGRPLNRRVDLGQIEGGLAQGLGWMTMEELRWDDQGRLESGALATYKVPDVYFMPDDLEVRFLEDSEGDLGPYGSKAVGEPPLMYGIGVFFALRAAMRAFQPDAELPFEAPLTPERVLMQTHRSQLEEIEQQVGQPGVVV
ncbi:MAG: molybdopterin cofactor-binding domain-containing protein, partial [Acidobacteriota bacterium]